MSESTIYAPLGHGGLLTHRGDYVWRKVPAGCIFITLVESASLSYTVYMDRFRRALKNPSFLKALRNPADPDNYIILREVLEEMPFNINTNRHPAMEEHGVLSVLTKDDEYPEAEYMLTNSHHDNTTLLDSGFYSVNVLKKKPIQDFETGKHMGMISEADLISRYTGALLPKPTAVIQSLKSDPRLQIFPGFFRIEEVDRAVRAWPFNINDTLESILSVAERSLEKLLIALTDGNQRAAAQHQLALQEYYDTILKEKATLVQGRMEDSNITNYPVMDTFIDIVEHIGKLSTKTETPAYQPEVIRLFDACVQLKRPRVGEQRPGKLFYQSFLFDNFPGIHVNMVCRAVGRGDLPAKKIREQRARSAGRTAARYNAAIARATAGRNRLPPLNVAPSNYPGYLEEQAAQRATAMRILEAQRAGPNRYVRNLSRRAQNRQLIAELRASGAPENYIRDLFPQEVAVLPMKPVSVANLRRTLRGSSNADDNGDVVFAPKLTQMTRKSNRSTNRRNK